MGIKKMFQEMKML